jgi:hypothetical protein
MYVVVTSYLESVIICTLPEAGHFWVDTAIYLVSRGYNDDYFEAVSLYSPAAVDVLSP